MLDTGISVIEPGDYLLETGISLQWPLSSFSTVNTHALAAWCQSSLDCSLPHCSCSISPILFTRTSTLMDMVSGTCQSRVRSEGGRVARIGRIPYNAVDYQ